MELDIEAPDEASVFGDATAALGELLGGKEPGEPASAALEVTASDRATLLADMLSELLFRAETEGFVPGALSGVELGERSLRATATGHRGQPSPLVKAVTYHRLRFERVGEGFRAGVVLDV